MNDLFKKRQHREPLELQLTAMIDIFSMLVIFLIFGTVIGAQEFIFPDKVQPPVSDSKESTETAPSLTIGTNQVTISVLENTAVPLNVFTGEADNPQRAALSEKLRSYLASADTKKDGNLLNVIADKDLPYRTLFDVIRVFKLAGFDTLLFITRDEKGRTQQ